MFATIWTFPDDDQVSAIMVQLTKVWSFLGEIDWIHKKQLCPNENMKGCVVQKNNWVGGLQFWPNPTFDQSSSTKIRHVFFVHAAESSTCQKKSNPGESLSHQIHGYLQIAIAQISAPKAIHSKSPLPLLGSAQGIDTSAEGHSTGAQGRL